MILAKLKGSNEDSWNTYWTMMDVDGIIHPISPELNKILNMQDWTSI